MVSHIHKLGLPFLGLIIIS